MKKNILAVIESDFTVTIYENNLSVGYLTDYFNSMVEAMAYAKSLTANVEVDGVA